MSDTPSILAVIPARGGSKRVPRKNLRLLAGQPLIVHAFAAARRCARLSRLVVSTDDAEIAALAKANGIEVPFMRPAALATDEATAVDVAMHALENVRSEDGSRYDILVWLQPTCPLRQPEDIDGTIDKLIFSGADSVFTVCPADSCNPAYWYVVDGDRPRPLMTPEAKESLGKTPGDLLLRNGAVYAVRTPVFLARKSFYGNDTRVYRMPAERSVNIDTELDFQLADVLARRES